MFKDYYLILCIGTNAKPDEIEKAYNDSVKDTDPDSIDRKEIQEAYTILANPETKLLYDKELVYYNSSSDFENYKIKDKKLAKTIMSLQNPNTYGISKKLESGCLLIVAFIFVLIFSMVFSTYMKSCGRDSVRYNHSYITILNQASHV